LKVRATQPATGFSEELTIDNALSQFQAWERSHAQARLGSMFDAAEGFIRADETFDEVAETETVPDEGKFADAHLLIKKAEAVKGSVGAEDARDIEQTCEQLQRAIAADDLGAVASLSEELDDILFYVR
jgi:hypothetical protein